MWMIYRIKAETVRTDRQPRDSRPALMMAGEEGERDHYERKGKKNLAKDMYKNEV